MKNDTAQYRQWIIAAAQGRSVPSDLALAVARQESRLQHYWQSGPHAGEVKISPKGAIGIMQVEPYNAGGRNLYDPKQNIEAGVAYLALMFQTFNSWPLAVAAYDAGEGRVSGWLRGINTLPRETVEYARAVAGVDLGGRYAGNVATAARSATELSGKQVLGVGLFVVGVWLLLR